MEIQLKELINHKVIVIGPSFLDQEKLESVKLLGVEEAGIWIESERAPNVIFDKFRVKPSSPGLAFFIPYAQIVTILASFDSTGGA